MGTKQISEETRKKMSESHIGKSSGMKGKVMSEEHKRKIGQANTHDDAGNKAIHIWITKYKGSPQICVDCGITAKQKKLQWSNVNHKYQRKLEDYVARCPSCHKKFDIQHNNYQMNGTFKKGFDERRIETQFKNGHSFRKNN